MSLKKFLNNLWQGIKHLFDGIEHEIKVLIPIAINVVQAIKAFEDSAVSDVLTALIPGNLATDVQAKLREFLPKLLLELQMTEAIASITDPNEQLKAILAKIKLSSDDANNVFYHGLASLILQKLSDGKFSWSDAIAVAEFYYQNEVKQNSLVTG